MMLGWAANGVWIPIQERSEKARCGAGSTWTSWHTELDIAAVVATLGTEVVVVEEGDFYGLGGYTLAAVVHGRNLGGTMCNYCWGRLVMNALLLGEWLVAQAGQQGFGMNLGPEAVERPVRAVSQGGVASAAFTVASCFCKMMPTEPSSSPDA